MPIHGINHDAMTAQAQYAEWLRRLQAENRAKIAIKPEEAEEAERETPSDQSEQDPEEEREHEPAADSESEGDGHLRSFA